MLDVLGVMVPIFLLISLGFLSIQLRWLSSEDYLSLTSFVMKISFPCLLLTKLSVVDLTQHFRGDILLIFGICSLFLALGSIQFFRRILGREDPQATLQGGMGVSLSNNGFIGYPVLFLVFASPPMTTYATVLLVENLVMLPLIIFLLNRASASGQTAEGRNKMAIIQPIATNPILIAVIAGMVVSLMPINLPEPLILSLSLLGTAAAPLALFAIGMALVRLPSIEEVTDIAWTGLGKLILHPALVAISCFLFVDNFNDPDIYAVILLASSPMASLYPIFGANYGAPDLTASTLSATTFLSLFTISGWILFLGI